MAEVWLLAVVAVAGGAFGAAIGALNAFAFTGFLVVVGEVVNVVAAVTGADALGAVAVTGEIAFGPVFGPHVAFAGGAAGVAYAAREGGVDTDFPYHQAKDVTTGLGTRPDVLAVGGVFGAVGYLVAVGSRAVGLPTDPLALGVVGSALAHRAALGYSLVGARPGEWLDMSPAVAADGGRAPRVEPWLPHQCRWSHVTALGLVAGVLGAYVAYRTASPFLAFGVSAATLVYANAGVERIPVTHHITLPASTVVLGVVPASAGTLTPGTVAAAVSLWAALALGGAMGVVGALLGELLQRVLYAHSETHLDPPAASIVGSSLLLGLLALVGVLPRAVWLPLP